MQKSGIETLAFLSLGNRTHKPKKQDNYGMRILTMLHVREDSVLNDHALDQSRDPALIDHALMN